MRPPAEVAAIRKRYTRNQYSESVRYFTQAAGNF
jgi:hypothetical protein